MAPWFLRVEEKASGNNSSPMPANLSILSGQTFLFLKSQYSIGLLAVCVEKGLEN